MDNLPDHRTLMISTPGNACKFIKIRQMPQELQDHIINGLDNGELTFKQAADYCKTKGHPVSHQGIWKYYKALRRLRWNYLKNQ